MSGSASASAGAVFSIFYGLFCTGFIFQFKEFTGLGLSPDNLLSSYLGSEDFKFIEFHLRKTAGTALLHASLPAGNIDTGQAY